MIWLIGGLFLFFSLIILFIVFKIFSLVQMRLDQMQKSLQEANKIIGQSLGSATGIFGNVEEHLGKLEATNSQILEVSKNISNLQELLRAPKFRGSMGETLLENMLAQVLPREFFQMQYRFRSSDTVDAVIRLGEKLVSIDAKFTLENFQKIQDAESEEEKNAHRRKFTQDVKNRIDEVAAKYILPQENTYDFALMYIPAENVYYELIIKEDLLSYCVLKKVIPVSPNTFYAYLQVICLGLKGLKIEENARMILKNLSTLSVEINKFKEDFDILGTHLSKAGSKYADSQKRLERFSERLTHIQEDKKLEAK